MRAVYVSVAALAVTLAVTSAMHAQATPAQGAAMQEADRKVAGGGIMAPGWKGTADAGGKVEDAKFVLAAGRSRSPRARQFRTGTRRTSPRVTTRSRPRSTNRTT